MDLQHGVLRRWRERLSGTPRLVLAVVLLAAGALVALTATAPPALGPVVVAARPLPAGAVVTADDLVVDERVTADRPDGALTASGPAVGRHVVGALARGEVLTTTRLAPEGFAAGLGSGRAVATATVVAGRAAVVRVGDSVRLVVAATSADPDLGLGGVPPAPTDTVTLSADARVLAIWPGGRDDDTSTLVVDVDVGSASRLAVLPMGLLVGCVIVTA